MIAATGSITRNWELTRKSLSPTLLIVWTTATNFSPRMTAAYAPIA